MNVLTARSRSAEIAGVENAARSKMQGWKLHEWKKEEEYK